MASFKDDFWQFLVSQMKSCPSRSQYSISAAESVSALTPASFIFLLSLVYLVFARIMS